MAAHGHPGFGGRAIGSVGPYPGDSLMAATPASRSLDKYHKTVTLADGSALHLRTIQRGDEEMLHALFSRSTSNTVHLRFHRVPTEISREVDDG